MFSRSFTQQLTSRLPEYANGSLNPVWTIIIRLWVSYSDQGRRELAMLRLLQASVKGQQVVAPPAELLGKIMANIKLQPVGDRPALRLKPLWLVPPILLIAALAILWLVYPPAITLEWSIRGQDPQGFRIYRAEVNMEDGQFVLLDELPVETGEQRYVYLDFRLSPGKSYQYRIEGIGQSGQPAVSQTVVGNSADVLPRLGVLTLAGLMTLVMLFEAVRQLTAGHRFPLWQGIMP